MIILCILWFILYNGVRVYYTVEHTHVTGTRAARCYRSAPSVRPIDVVAILVVQPSSSTVVTLVAAAVVAAAAGRTVLCKCAIPPDPYDAVDCLPSTLPQSLIRDVIIIILSYTIRSYYVIYNNNFVLYYYTALRGIIIIIIILCLLR